LEKQCFVLSVTKRRKINPFVLRAKTLFYTPKISAILMVKPSIKNVLESHDMSDKKRRRHCGKDVEKGGGDD